MSFGKADKSEYGRVQVYHGLRYCNLTVEKYILVTNLPTHIPQVLSQKVSHSRCSRILTLVAPHIDVRKLADDNFRAQSFKGSHPTLTKSFP